MTGTWTSASTSASQRALRSRKYSMQFQPVGSPDEVQVEIVVGERPDSVGATSVRAAANIDRQRSVLVDLHRRQRSLPFHGFIKADDAVPMKARGRLNVARDDYGNLLVDGYYQTLKPDDSWWEPNGIMGQTADFPPAPRSRAVSAAHGALVRPVTASGAAETRLLRRKTLFMCTHTPHTWEKISRLSGTAPVLLEADGANTANTLAGAGDSNTDSAAVKAAEEAVVRVDDDVLFPRYLNAEGTNADARFRDWHLFFDHGVQELSLIHI